MEFGSPTTKGKQTWSFSEPSASWRIYPVIKADKTNTIEFSCKPNGGTIGWVAVVFGYSTLWAYYFMYYIFRSSDCNPREYRCKGLTKKRKKNQIPLPRIYFVFGPEKKNLEANWKNFHEIILYCSLSEILLKQCFKSVMTSSCYFGSRVQVAILLSIAFLLQLNCLKKLLTYDVLSDILKDTKHLHVFGLCLIYTQPYLWRCSWRACFILCKPL